MIKKGDKRGRQEGARTLVGKRGQLKISFGVMFSIFLIIVFIFFAIKIIYSFVAVNQCVNVADFYVDFQDSIDKARSSQETNQPYGLDLGSTVDKVCFVDLDESQRGPNPFPDAYGPGDNIILIFNDDACSQLENNKIEGLNISLITELENPRCFDNGDQILIKKSLYSRLVTLE